MGKLIQLILSKYSIFFCYFSNMGYPIGFLMSYPSYNNLSYFNPSFFFAHHSPLNTPSIQFHCIILLLSLTHSLMYECVWHFKEKIYDARWWNWLIKTHFYKKIPFSKFIVTSSVCVNHSVLPLACANLPFKHK